MVKQRSWYNNGIDATSGTQTFDPSTHTTEGYCYE